MKQILLDRIYPHRGVGDENTLTSLENGLLLQPEFLEFDVQYHHQNLYLGHPPSLERTATLEEALRLFSGHKTIPKVDLKLTERTKAVGLWKFLKIIDTLPFNVLVNVSDSLPPKDCLQAEQIIMKYTTPRVLLNIDLSHYGDVPIGEIDAHIRRLPRKPFSISPNLEASLFMTEALANRHGIKHIHFWSHPQNTYPVHVLEQKMDGLLQKGFEVYFDITQRNIMSRRRPLTPLAI